MKKNYKTVKRKKQDLVILFVRIKDLKSFKIAFMLFS